MDQSFQNMPIPGPFKIFANLLACVFLFACSPKGTIKQQKKGIHLEIEQITHGHRHHFFGYIGHVQNIPWNGNERYILSLEVDFIDRMPKSEDVADILLIDTQENYSIKKVAETLAWNPQQGSMMYWNPDAPDTQFFFNDRDPETNHIFCVLFDIEKGKRVWEYTYSDTPLGNGGVRQNGGGFAAINYGRMARLRPVTGYPDAYDWNPKELHPENDGIFYIETKTGVKYPLVSFKQMRDVLIDSYPRIDTIPLFINHTLWNRRGDRLYFFVRGHFGRKATRINVPMTVQLDGTGLVEQSVFIGGHPEWEFGNRMIGMAPLKKEGPFPVAEKEERLVLYDSEAQKVIEPIGNGKAFPDPENDVALSPDGNWLVQGFEEGTKTAYSIYRRSDGAYAQTNWYDQQQFYKGKLRIDAAPKWNRNNDQILFSSLTQEEEPRRQLFLTKISEN